MTKQIAFAIILASQCLCAARAGPPPDFATVHGLYHTCSGEDDLSKGYCLGFIAGVAATMRTSTLTLGQQRSFAFCAPKSTTHEQAVQAFKNWHEQHPEHWQRSAEVGVMAALQETWPCSTAPHPAPPRDQH